ncbi:hypothetical protein E4V99_13985 [Microbacterium sp. dk485]|uniref:hypothetical protein n=1 Tax=Microbacterium sp. dk485 TaxID=2560021 RepID=UPI0010745376|nr:hypothetical protein [Microbacterium sp. dk485]TFV82039.1 hypothetical protein E4V99_13985 [Microbacterium sp. dk485]
MEWYSVKDEAEQTRLLAAWPDAPLTNLEACGMLLDVAREQVLAYAPAPTGGVVVEDGYITPATTTPTRYVYAQLQQAINLWNAGRVSSTGDIGGEGFSFTPRPLDKTIKGIIRPVDGKPHVL